MAGQLEVRIDRRFPLAEAGDAHRYMEAGKTRGKVLLEP
jgi:NADPH2:quinone reductase